MQVIRLINFDSDWLKTVSAAKATVFFLGLVSSFSDSSAIMWLVTGKSNNGLKYIPGSFRYKVTIIFS